MKEKPMPKPAVKELAPPKQDAELHASSAMTMEEWDAEQATMAFGTPKPTKEDEDYAHK